MSSVHAPVAPAATPVVTPRAVAPAVAARVPAAPVPADPASDRLRYIAGRSLLSLHGVPGMRLRVEQGQVWITQSGRPDDHVLGPGDWLLPQDHGLLLVYAFEPARVAVSTPPVERRVGHGAWAGLGRTLRAWLTPAWRTPPQGRAGAGAQSPAR